MKINKDDKLIILATVFYILMIIFTRERDKQPVYDCVDLQTIYEVEEIEGTSMRRLHLSEGVSYQHGDWERWDTICLKGAIVYK